MKQLTIMAMVALMTLTVGCANTGAKSQGGAVIGAVLGGIAGNKLAGKNDRKFGTLLGAIVGGTIGNKIGQSMDKTDALAAQNAINNQPTGQTKRWSNPDTNMQYDVTPTRTYRNQSSGDFCREVTIGEARIGGKREEVYGTSCRQPDGSWKMQ